MHVNIFCARFSGFSRRARRVTSLQGSISSLLDTKFTIPCSIPLTPAGAANRQTHHIDSVAFLYVPGTPTLPITRVTASATLAQMATACQTQSQQCRPPRLRTEPRLRHRRAQHLCWSISSLQCRGTRYPPRVISRTCQFDQTRTYVLGKILGLIERCTQSDALLCTLDYCVS